MVFLIKKDRRQLCGFLGSRPVPSLGMPTGLADGLGREGAPLAERYTPHTNWIPRSIRRNEKSVVQQID